jgi:hypothetical protein
VDSDYGYVDWMVAEGRTGTRLASGKGRPELIDFEMTPATITLGRKQKNEALALAADRWQREHNTLPPSELVREWEAQAESQARSQVGADWEGIAEKWTRTTLWLSENYGVELPAPDEPPLTGFGLRFRLRPEPAFSWEWFKVLDGVAIKLQEEGKLSFSVRSYDEKVDITCIMFETGVSLRAGRGQLPDVDWRLFIRRGSYIRPPLTSEEG